jgi:hypothetical protein
MMARSVGITEPTVAPMPWCTSGIAATWWCTIGSCEMLTSWRHGSAEFHDLVVHRRRARRVQRPGDRR